jgi:hypothetical protein
MMDRSFLLGRLAAEPWPEQYEAVFRENAIDASVLPSLTADDLKDLGIILVGHRLLSAGRFSAAQDQQKVSRLPASPILALAPYHSARYPVNALTTMAATVIKAGAVTRIVQAPFALTVAVAFPASLLLAGLIVAILLTPLNGERRDGMPSLRWLTALRINVVTP